VFLVPLDRSRSRYRYHHLFRDLLRHELELEEPGASVEIAANASAWCEEHGEIDAAVEYAIASGDIARLARLVASHALSVYEAGRAASVMRWLESFDDDVLLHAYPLVAAVGAGIYARRGRPAQSARWLEAAQAGSSDEAFPDGTTLAGSIALVHVAMGADGPDALDGVTPGSEWR